MDRWRDEEIERSRDGNMATGGGQGNVRSTKEVGKSTKTNTKV